MKNKDIPASVNIFEFLHKLDKNTLVDMVMLGRTDKHIRAIYRGAKKDRDSMQ